MGHGIKKKRGARKRKRGKKTCTIIQSGPDPMAKRKLRDFEVNRRREVLGGGDVRRSGERGSHVVRGRGRWCKVFP